MCRNQLVPMLTASNWPHRTTLAGWARANDDLNGQPVFCRRPHRLNHLLRIVRRYSPNASTTGVVKIFVREHPFYR